jgi:predicted permease
MHDIKLAFRQLAKTPGFATTVVLTIALGIGANTAIFTLVHAILMKSLPVVEPTRLYRIGDKDDCCVNGGFINDNGDFDIFSYELYRQFRDAAPEFEQLTAFQAGHDPRSVRRGDSAGKVERSEFVSGNYFSTFGVGALLGRTILPSDDVPGAQPVAVLSYAAWQADYAGDPTVVGETVFVQSLPVTIIGVAPAGFYGDRLESNPAALWIPLNVEPVMDSDSPILNHADSNWLYVLGRVRPGVSTSSLQAKLTTTLRNWLPTRDVYTTNGGDKLIPKQYVVLTSAGGGIQILQQNSSRALYLLIAISGLVLLVACANVANLLLARGATRRVEVSIRMALGAARRRLIRQMLVESVLLGLLSGICGIVLAYVGARMILVLAFPDSPNLPFSASPSPMILAFAFVLSVITGVVFGIVPAWITSHSHPVEALRGATRSTRDHASLPQKSLIVVQAALSLVLLVGAGLLTQTLRNLERQDFGISTTNRYVVHLDPRGAGYTAARLQPLYDRMEHEFASLPGMQSIGMALYSTLEENNWGESIYIEGKPTPTADTNHNSSWDRVSPHFFETIGQPVIRGRGFTEQDTASSRMVAVVNQAFVKKFFPKEDPIGQHFGTFDQKYSSDYEIVGVVADAKYTTPRDPVRPMYFRPLTQWNTGMKEDAAATAESSSLFIDSITLRFAGQPRDVESMMRRTLASINPNLSVIDIHSLDYQVAGNFNEERLIARLTMLFGGLALVLASVGLYGITAYSVARRTSEIGVRMALGANRGNVVRLVLRGVAIQIGLGLAIGIPFALVGGKFMASQLYGVRIYDPVTMMLAIGTLGAFAALAGFLPAKRAASIAPMKALRTE